MCSKVRTPRQLLACPPDPIDQVLTCSVLVEGRFAVRRPVTQFAFPVSISPDHCLFDWSHILFFPAWMRKFHQILPDNIIQTPQDYATEYKDQHDRLLTGQIQTQTLEYGLICWPSWYVLHSTLYMTQLMLRAEQVFLPYRRQLLTWRFPFVSNHILIVIFAQFVSVLALTPSFSESFEPLEQFSYIPTKAVNIAKWREDISGATPSDLFFCSLDFQDMNNPDVFELKHDSASEYSMDSAYQSQTSATRRGTTMPEVYQPLAAPDTQTRVNSQFIYSPTLSSDNFNAFSEPQSDMSQMHLPSAARDVEAGENSFPYANHTSAQDYSPYTTAAVQQFPDMGFQQWGSADAQAYTAPFSYASHPKSSHSLDTTLYLSQDPNEIMFNTQQHLSKPRIDTSVRTSVRSSSYNTHQPQQSSSTHDAGFSFVLSPTSAIPDFEQLLETR